MGEGDPGKGVVGLIKAGFLGFEVLDRQVGLLSQRMARLVARIP
jgi:hypothetical protein